MASTVIIPLLDRLIDRDPDVKEEEAPSRSEAERILIRGVRRDLRYLLNTRRISKMPDEHFKELNTSVYVYGLPELSTMSTIAATDRGRLMELIKETITLFESRLDEVQLVPMEDEPGKKNVVRFRIEATLKVESMAERVWFETTLDTKSGHCVLSGDNDA